jgi:DNA segregation ATPase FtsK/SpoIIIE-like protein
MGKKRSQTAKQVQKKVVKKLARAFGKQLGVSVVDNSNKGRATSGAMAIESHHHNGKAAGNVANRKQQRHLLRPKKAALLGSTPRSQQKQQQQQQQQQQQKKGADDFAREQASLREREQVVEWKRNHQQGGSKKKATRHNKNKQPPSPGPLAFQPPAFCYLESQKTAEQIMDETTVRVHTALQGIGRHEPPADQRMLLQAPTPTIGSSSLAAAAAARWSSANEPATEGNALVSPNPWSALQQDDEDEDEGVDGMRQQQQQQQQQPQQLVAPFSFAPPSFAYGTTPPVVAATTNATADWTTDVLDPDL